MKLVYNAQMANSDLEMYEKYTPDLITLDVTMPVMDGIETAKDIVFQKSCYKNYYAQCYGR